MKVLVAYATCHGSTRRIAERIAAGMRAAGNEVECRAMGEMETLSDYQAAVVGSAVHNQAWLGEGTDFVRRFAPVLAERPVWVFSVGMPGALARRLQGWAMTEESAILGKLTPAIQPRGHRLLTGAVDTSHLSPAGRLQFKMMGGRYGDFTDWQEVDSFGREIARELQAIGSAPSATSR